MSTPAPDRVDFGRRTLVMRRSRIALRLQTRSVCVCTVLAVVTLVLGAWALTLGDYTLSLAQVWRAVIDDPDAGFARQVVFDWRLPRVLAAVVFGAALAVAGAMFQSLTRNPLASPDIIGFTAGSYSGALIVIVLLDGGYATVAGGALLGGIATATLVYVLAWRHGVQSFRLIIVGIALSAMLHSLNTWLTLTADLDVALGATAWGAGSLSNISWSQAGVGTGVVVLLLAVTAVLAPSLRQLELGDDAALATGIHAERVRLAVVVVGVGLVATVTAAAGPISFVALAAPQIARRIARTPGVTIAPAAFTGALLLLAADVVAQHVLPTSLPVGVVTVVGGGGYLAWLLVREVRRRA